MAEKLTDLGQPIVVRLLVATVAAFYGTGSKEEVCLDYWNELVLELLEAQHDIENPVAVPSFEFGFGGMGSVLSQRRQLYASTISKLRTLMFCRMGKPEEVLIVNGESGNMFVKH